MTPFSACDRSFVSTISPKSKNGTFTAPVSPRFMEKNQLYSMKQSNDNEQEYDFDV